MHALVRLHDAPDATARTNGKRLLRSAVHCIHRIDATTEVDAVLTDRPIASYLGTLSSTADLAVIGGHESGLVRDRLFGRNAHRIVAVSRCPVVVWRPHSAPLTRAGAVIVEIDRSDASGRAAALAFSFAHIMKSTLIAVHVGTEQHHTRNVGESGVEIDDCSLEWLRSRIEPLQQRHPTVGVHIHCLQAPMEAVLRHASSNAELVVVDYHDRRMVGAAMRESITEQLVHSARCPMLVVHRARVKRPRSPDGCVATSHVPLSQLPDSGDDSMLGIRDACEETP